MTELVDDPLMHETPVRARLRLTETPAGLVRWNDSQSLANCGRSAPELGVRGKTVPTGTASCHRHRDRFVPRERIDMRKPFQNNELAY
jgi:hypothetical protein